MKKITFLSLFTCIATVHADDAKIAQRLQSFGIKDVEITSSPIAGLRTVITDKGLFYASEDGRYYLQGALVEMKEDGQTVDLSNRPLLGRLNDLVEEAIIYPAKNEKYIVTAFFDNSCGYCRKMHKDIKEYNDLGITIRYLAFPRHGLESKTARQMETVFNADDKAQAMSDLENGKPMKETAVDKVAKHYQLGLQFGVQGTPTLIFPDGSTISSYLEPQTMLELLEETES